MSYERTDIDNQVSKLQTLIEEIQDLPDVVPDETNIGLFNSSGNTGDAFGELTGIKSDTPIQSNLTDLDEDGAATGTTDRINLSSSLTVVDYVIPIVNIDLRFINFKPSNGSRVKFTPKVGRTLVIKTGGDFDIGSDITIADNEYKEFIFLDETQTGISGGGFVPSQDLSGSGGGEFFGPMTADHNYGGFNIFNSTGIFFDAGLTTGVLFNSGGIGLIAPTNDTIDFFINDLVTPKFGITETSIETNEPLNFANPGNRIINGLDVLNFDAVDQSIRSVASSIRHDVPSTDSHRFRVSNDEKAVFDQFGTTFKDNVDVDSKIFSVTNGVNFFQIFQDPFNLSESIQNFNDTLMFQRAANDILQINSNGILLPDSKTLNFDDLFTTDTFQISQALGETILNYTGDMIIKESGNPILTLGGLLIEVEKNMDMKNNEINNAFTVEIEENFTAGGVPSRPINGVKLFVRQQFSDANKNELRAYFQTGSSQLITSEP